MHSSGNTISFLYSLNALAGSLFIVGSFAIVVTRQVRACLKAFIVQSVFFAFSALVLGIGLSLRHLIVLAILNVLTKAFLLPFFLRKLLKYELHIHRETNPIISIPASLIIALGLTIGAYFFSLPWLKEVQRLGFAYINIPIGLAGLFFGAYTIVIRREAVPQLLGLLAMENGTFFAGIAMAPDLPFIVELSVVFDVIVLIFIMGILTKAIYEKIGTTMVGSLDSLREEKSK